LPAACYNTDRIGGKTDRLPARAGNSIKRKIMSDQEKPKADLVTRILRALAVFFLLVGIYYFAKAMLK